MKRIFSMLTLSLLVVMLACNDSKKSGDEMASTEDKKEDSKDVAEDANDEKFDDADDEKDADFVANTVASNYGEITFAQLANQKSSNAEVKQLATMLINDHTKTLNELKTLAQAKAITIPVEEDDAARRKTKQYNDEAGKDFDKKWTKEMIDRHEETINKFEKRFDKTEDAELKAWISSTLPHLRMHLEKLNACLDKIKDTNS